MARPNWEYVRVDVLLPSNHKLDGLHPAAKWTLIELWCHCGQHLTDGYVRDAMWRKIGTPRTRQAIIAAGLAEKVDGGYQMHDYLEHQRSRADVLALKKKRADAGRKGGTARANAKQVLEQVPKQTSSKSVAEAEAEAEAELVADVVTPTDPSSNYTSKNISLPYANGHLEGTKGRLALKPETLINETPKTRRKFRTEQERQLEALAQWQRENPQPEDTHGQPG